jgi:hypothetical protein
MNCMQLFPRPKIVVFISRLGMIVILNFKSIQNWTIFQHRAIHCQLHDDRNDNCVVIFEGINVCSIVWRLILGISRAMFFWYAIYAMQGIRSDHHGNVGKKKPCTIEYKQ